MAKLETRKGYVPNHKDFGRYIRSREAGSVAGQIAQLAADFANASAPVQDPEKAKREGSARRRKPLKGSYRSRRLQVPLGKRGTRRAAAEVFSNAQNAAPIEFGSPTTGGPRRVLARASIAAAKAVVKGGTK